MIYDSDKPNARLIGTEYIISDKLFETLPEEEKVYWHSHKYEVQSGTLQVCIPDHLACHALPAKLLQFSNCLTSYTAVSQTTALSPLQACMHHTCMLPATHQACNQGPCCVAQGYAVWAALTTPGCVLRPAFVLQAPRVPVQAENLEMQKLVNTYGKTFHTWQVDRGDVLPFGKHA